MKWSFAIALLIAAFAASPARADDPKPLDVMRSAGDAMASVKSISCKAEVRGVGSQALRTPELSASIEAKRADKKDPLGWKFRIEGKARQSGPATGERDLLAAYDGKTVRSLRATDKKLLEAAPENAKEALDDGSGAALAWLLRWKELVNERFADPENLPVMRYEGRSEIDGVSCDVVYVDYSDTSDPNLMDAWWYLASTDHLPRRVDMHLVSNSAGDGFVVVTLSGLKPGDAVEESSLALAAPEGYEVVKAKEPEHEPGMGAAVKASTLAVGEKAPDWELKDPEGKAHRLSDYAGKVVVMDFWATWCGPCQMAMPGIQKVHDAFKGKPVEVFGIDCWESGDAPKFMKEKGFTYGLLLQGDPAAKDYGVSGIPTFYVIGKDGRIVHVSVGFNPAGEEQLEKVINDALSAKAPAGAN